MTENRFIVILTILVFILSGFIGWHLLSPEGGDREISVKKQASLLNTGIDDERENGKEAKMIGSRNSVSLTIANDSGRVSYYDSTSGMAFEIGLDGSSEKTLSPNRLPNFLRTIWSPNKKEVVSVFASQGNFKSYSYYNYTTKKSSRLASGIKSVAFSPSGDRIAYFKEEANGLFALFLSAPDGSTPQKIMSTRITDASISWPLKDAVSLKSNDGDGRSSLFLVSLDGKFNKVVSDKTSLSVNWRQDGGRVLISYLSEDAGILSIVDPTSGAEKKIPASAEADECAWISSESVTCRISENSNGSIQTSGLYDIYFADGSVKYIQGSQTVAGGIKEILVNPTNSYILFTTSGDGKLFSLKR
ncbi:MAG: hypothetical protein AAB667_00130 [Patescibacteria group bacterium]